MSIISTNNRQAKLFYNGNTSIGRQTLAFSQSLSLDVLALDIVKTNLTATQWIEITTSLKTDIADLIDKEHPDFKDNYGDNIKLDANGWLKILNNNPEVCKNAILLYKDNYHLIEKPNDILRYTEANSSSIDPNNHDKE